MIHTLIWKSPLAPVSQGRSTLLLGWQRYEMRDNTADRFKKVGSPGPLDVLAGAALDGAIAAGRDVTIGQQREDPETTPAVELLESLMELRPVDLICPERPARHGSGVRWVTAHLSGAHRTAAPRSVPEAAIHGVVSTLAKGKYPAYNAAPSTYHSVPALLLRHGVTAEGLRIIEPEVVTPDMILNSVADDSAVVAAMRAWDRATLSTHRDLARARDAAQERIGVPPDERVFLYSAEVDGELLPIVMRMGRGEEAAKAQVLQRNFNQRYGELGPRVLASCFRSYRHGNIDGLRHAVEALQCEAEQP
jgi:hypothetical protein